MERKIYSNRCWVNGLLQAATVSMQNGKISDVFFGLKEGSEDFGDTIVMPGVIDAHVHVNEPGRTGWEGFATATQAAAAGGTTTIIDMPLNASPVTTTVEAFKKKLAATEGKLRVNVGFYGGLVPGNINEIKGLAAAGVLGIKCFLTHSGIDEFPNVTVNDLEEAMPVIAQQNIPLLVHCELDDGKKHSNMQEHPTSYKEYLAGRPKKWENDAIEMMIGLCEKHKCKTHIVHVASAEALSYIKAAKAAGARLTAETCPQYIYFNAEEIPDAGTLYKCAPPIREKENNEQLKIALGDAVLDFITTDHSPAPPDIKEIESGDLQKAWGGIAGLQFLLSSSYTALKENISLEKFIPLLTEHPAVFLGIENMKGFLKKGFDADIVLWRPEEKAMVSETAILHRHKASPYNGKILYGVVQETIVAGVTVYKDKQIIHKNAGQWLLKK